MSWIVLFTICLAVVLIFGGIGTVVEMMDRYKTHTKKEIALMSVTKRTALLFGFVMVFSGVFMNISPDGESTLLVRLLSSVCLSVGGSLSVVGLYALFEIQDKRRNAELSSKLVFMTRTEYRDKYGYEDFI